MERTRWSSYSWLHARVFTLLAGAIALSGGVSAWADRIIFDDSRFQQAYEQVLATHAPDMPASKRELLLSRIQPREAVLDGVPETALRLVDGRTELQGRIRQVIPGLRQGDPMDPDQHDRLVIDTGVSGQGPTVVVSVFYIHAVESMVDSAEDFAWLFSDRHERLLVRPGSPAHRQAIFALVDPDGWLGLSDGDVPEVPEPLAEGMYTQYLLNGRPDHAQALEAARWPDGTPFPLRASASHPAEARQVADTALLVTPFADGMDSLLAAVVQVERYSGYPDGFRQWAMDSLDMLCRLRVADPALADGDGAVLAERARNLGEGCYQQLTGALWAKDSWAIEQRFPVHAFSADDHRGAVLDLLDGAETFRTAILMEPVEFMAPIELAFEVPPVIDLPGMSGTRTVDSVQPAAAGGSVGDDGFQLAVEARQLLLLVTDLAAGGRQEMADQASRIVLQWLGAGHPDEDQRYWRDALWEYNGFNHLSEPAEFRQTSFRLMCEAGWSLLNDMSARVDLLIAKSRDLAIESPGYSENALSLLATISDTAGTHGEYGQQLAAYIDERLDKEPRCCEPEQVIWEQWLEISARTLDCASIATIDLARVMSGPE